MKRKKLTHLEGSASRHNHRDSSAVEKYKQQWLGYLQRQSEKLSLRQRKTLWIILGLAIATACISIIVQSFRQAPGTTLFMPGPFKVPSTVSLDPNPELITVYHSLQVIQKTLDSLQESEEGKKLYEHMINKRPGLVDSLDFLLEHYRHLAPD